MFYLPLIFCKTLKWKRVYFLFYWRYFSLIDEKLWVKYVFPEILLLGHFSFEYSSVNRLVGAKETDKSTAPLNNSKHSASHSSCQLLEPLTLLSICVLWLCTIGCVLNDQNQMNKIVEKSFKLLNWYRRKNIQRLLNISNKKFLDWNLCRPSVVIQ